MFGIMQQKLCKNNSSNKNRFNYCGTCKSIGTSYGHKSRLFLNYDIVFLSTLLNDLQEKNSYPSAYSEKSCWSLPQNKTIPVVFKYASALNVYLAGVKIRDNVRDSVWFEKLKWSFTRVVYWRSLKSAKQTLRNLGFPIEKVDHLINDSFANENIENLSLDEYVDPTAKITGIAFKHGAKLIDASIKDENNLESIGNSLGKLVYYSDVKEDLASDIKNRNFNPVIASNKITIKNIVEKSVEQCDLLFEALSNLTISPSIKSRYLLQISSLRSEETGRDNKESNDNFSCTNCCDLSPCCDCLHSKDSSCCDCGSDSCSDGCCDCTCDCS